MLSQLAMDGGHRFRCPVRLVAPQGDGRRGGEPSGVRQPYLSAEGVPVDRILPPNRTGSSIPVHVECVVAQRFGCLVRQASEVQRSPLDCLQVSAPYLGQPVQANYAD